MAKVYKEYSSGDLIFSEGDEIPNWAKSVIKDILKRFQELELKYLNAELKKKGY